MQQLRESFTNGLVWVERWKEVIHPNPQHPPQVAQLAIGDLNELRFDFGNAASADIQAGELEMQSKNLLRPSPFSTQSADDRPCQILMSEKLHVAET